MKLIQFFLPGKGQRVGLVRGDRVLDLTRAPDGIRSTVDLVAQAKTAEGLAARVEWMARRAGGPAVEWSALQRPPSRRVAHLILPIDPPEVWAVRDAPDPAASGRPWLDFKATAWRCAGPFGRVGLREDSVRTIARGRLAAVLGPTGAPVAYTACLDLVARDLGGLGTERVARAATYAGCCALGPCLVTPEELEAPEGLQVTGRLLRENGLAWECGEKTVELPRRLVVAAAWLTGADAVPVGSVLIGAGGLEPPEDAALRIEDRVELEIQGVGRLSCSVAVA
jgi:hypothetical protein